MAVKFKDQVISNKEIDIKQFLDGKKEYFVMKGETHFLCNRAQRNLCTTRKYEDAHSLAYLNQNFAGGPFIWLTKEEIN